MRSDLLGVFIFLTAISSSDQHAAEVKIRTLKTFGAGGGIIDDET